MPSVIVEQVAKLTHVQLGACAGLFAELVLGGAALGWVEPPAPRDVEGLMAAVASEAAVGDAAIVIARKGDALVGLGYWRRYARPTARPNADVEKLFVDPAQHGHGVGRAILQALIDAARACQIETLTLDFRDGNPVAEHLYASAGFTEYGRRARFLAFGDRRYDQRLWALDLRRG